MHKAFGLCAFFLAESGKRKTGNGKLLFLKIVNCCGNFVLNEGTKAQHS